MKHIILLNGLIVYQTDDPIQARNEYQLLKFEAISSCSITMAKVEKNSKVIVKRSKM